MKNNTIVLTISSSGAMASTNTITSNAIPVDQLWGFAIQAVWTGTPTGTIKLQASSDSPVGDNAIADPSSTITNWSDISNSSYSITGAAGNYMWNFSGCGFRFVRVSYTNASGSGTLTAKLSAKGV